MRILIACDTFTPDVNGAARFAERLAAGLVTRGHDLHIVAPASSRRTSGTFVETIEGQQMTVHRWPSWRWPLHDWLRFVLPWMSLPRSRKLLDGLQPDVIHFQSHIIIGRGIVIEGAKRRIRMIGTNHVMPENVLDHTALPSWLRGPFIRWGWWMADRTFRRAVAMTTPTRRAAEFLENNTSLTGVLPVSCGIDASNYSPSFEPRLRNTALFVGRLTGEKHVEVILQALAMLDPTLEVHLDIVGDGDQRKSLEQATRSLGLEHRVVFHGRISEEELREKYTKASVFVIASIAELQSIATMEALASGLPVVGANAMALPHLVHDGENGYLFSPGDAQELAEKLTQVLTAPAAEYERMQRSALKAVEAHDIQRTLTTFESLYRGTPAKG
jgi:glycosyltransferase involved in cell wall biosynthesis